MERPEPEEGPVPQRKKREGVRGRVQKNDPYLFPGMDPLPFPSPQTAAALGAAS
jgi:hypothetical protein